jgi:alcohol-forming fatty acyl-CoA reductase
MTKLYAKIDQFGDVLSYFTTRQWDFTDFNTQGLHQACSEADKALFPLNISDLNWESYLKNYMIGLRLYLLKETNDNLPVARRKYFA